MAWTVETALKQKKNHTEHGYIDSFTGTSITIYKNCCCKTKLDAFKRRDWHLVFHSVLWVRLSLRKPLQKCWDTRGLPLWNIHWNPRKLPVTITSTCRLRGSMPTEPWRRKETWKQNIKSFYLNVPYFTLSTSSHPRSGAFFNKIKCFSL